jgi:hypothetical protein
MLDDLQIHQPETQPREGQDQQQRQRRKAAILGRTDGREGTHGLNGFSAICFVGCRVFSKSQFGGKVQPRRGEVGYDDDLLGAGEIQTQLQVPRPPFEVDRRHEFGDLLGSLGIPETQLIKLLLALLLLAAKLIELVPLADITYGRSAQQQTD